MAVSDAELIPAHPHPAHLRVQAAMNAQERAAEVITAFAGSMTFTYIHACAFALWMVFGESNPWPMLTLVVSLEAIFLSTFVMIGQNRQAKLAAAKAADDYAIGQKLLEDNTRMTAEIHAVTVK